MTLDEIHAMDDRALDRVIAEALEQMPSALPEGAFDRVVAGYQVWSPKRCWYVGYDYDGGDGGAWLPKHFSTDLNACAEVEKQVHASAYIVWLEVVVNDGPLVFATARQRAEALAAVLGERSAAK